MIGPRVQPTARGRHAPSVGMAPDDHMDAVPVKLLVVPSSVSIPVLGVAQLSVTELSSDGSRRDVTNMVTWLSSNPLKATIDLLGVVLGVALGTSTITASLGALSTTTNVTVTL